MIHRKVHSKEEILLDLLQTFKCVTQVLQNGEGLEQEQTSTIKGMEPKVGVLKTDLEEMAE